MKTLLSLLILGLVQHSSLASSANPELRYFPENYEASKARFLGYVEKLRADYRGVETRAITVGEERLTVDTVYIPAQRAPRSLIVITSGTHGPEAYAGSALQSLFIEQILPGMNLETTGVLLVHALNPWGFKHHRRDTENHVNLNRNFDLTREIFATENQGYEKLRRYLEPAGRLRSAAKKPANSLLLQMAFRRGVTQQSLTEAIGKGQYTSRLGINYGGQDFETQTLDMIALLKQVAAPYAKMFHIDLHTGLGKRGVLHLMTKKELNAASRESQAKLLNSAADRGRYEITPPEAEGFYEIHGDYANILSKLFPEEERVIIGITAEFGTVGNGLKGKVVTINRLVNENRGHHHGYANSAVEAKVKGRYLELFYPSSVEWKNSVLSQGRYLLDTVVKRFVAQNP